MDETKFLLRQRGAPPKPGIDRHNEFKNSSSSPNDDKKKGSSGDGQALDGITIYLLLIIFYGFIVFFIHFRQNNSFPTPKFIGDPQNSMTDFIEERVRKNLNKFMKLGPRVTGSAANLKAKDLILKTIEEIRVGAKEPHQIEVDNQIVDGDFAIDFLVGHLTSVYKNINNIIVNFSRKDNPSNHSVLVNCHYDTFLSSPGGSDDTVSCCVMLEMLRSFSQHTEPFKNNIIFLFNGAEENILQASHGFITKHPWGKTIKAFVNLEATGAGGWEVVFQTGPENPWLVRSYIKSVKYPSASVFNQEIFQTGKIPGDTDFRIFRDYGNLAGLDIAHIKNGYVYHTKNDLPRYIQPGSIQRGGENLMNLVETLVSSPQLVNPGPEKHGTMVFYDFIGYFMVSYPMRMAIILNLGISTLFLLTIFRKIVGYNTAEIKGVVYVRELVMAVIFLLLTWTLIIITCVVIALLLTMLGREMSWFTNTFNLIWLYILPPITSVLSLHWILCKTYYKSTNGWQVEGIFYDGNMLLWVMLLVTLTYFKIASAYMVLLWTLFPLLIISRTAKALKINFKEKPVIYVILKFISVLIPASYTIYLTYNLSMLIITVMGRCGTEVKPDIPVSIIVSFPVLLLTGYHCSFVYISRNIGKLILILSAISTTGILAVLFTPYGFPFSTSLQDASMQRVMLVHFDRNNYHKSGEKVEKESYVWYFQLDHHGSKALEKYSTVFENASLAPCDGAYCGMPFYFPVLHMIDSRKTLQVPAPRLTNYPRSSVNLVSKDKTGVDTFRLTFQIEGSDHITNFVFPKPGVKLTRWSLEDGDPLPIKTLSVFQRPTYYIYYSHEIKPVKPWQFSLTVQIDKSQNPDDGILDISVVGHYLHGEKMQTPFLSHLLKKLPEWTVDIGVTATIDYHEF